MNSRLMPEQLAQHVWLRRLRPDDLMRASEISSLAGWNQTIEDWRMLLALEPKGCFVVEADGDVAATATLVRYGARLAWVGMVLTRPEYRRRGFARRLVATILEWADALGIATVMLDATEQGSPLYEAFGFRVMQAVERWSRVGMEARVGIEESSLPPGHSIPHGPWLERDAVASGVDRSSLLKMLAGRGRLWQGPEGYLLSRMGRVSRHLGPCVAERGNVAEGMMQQCIESETESSWIWDLLPQNREAVRLANALGFSPARRLQRMVRGGGVQARAERIFATAGFEFG